MRRYLLYLLFVLWEFSFSQPIIDSSNFSPKVWEYFARERDKFTSINYWSTGANYTWNFTSAPFVALDTIMYDTVDAGSCQVSNPIFFGMHFTHAQINFYSYSANAGDCPTYYKIFRGDGAYDAGYGAVQSASDYNYKKFPFPLGSLTNYSTTVYGTNYDYFNNTSSTSTYNHYIIADGYGTLTLPGGISYQNCLRIRQHNGDSTGGNPFIDTTYFWLVPGIHHPVLEVWANSPWRDAYYIKGSGSVAGIERFKDNKQLILSPNPADNITWIRAEYETSEPPKIFGAVGDEFKVSVTNLDPQKIELDLTSLPSGIYFVRLKLGDRVYSRKLIVQKG